jgi:hypothetical protein
VRPVVPQGLPDAPCAIVFGHNVSIRKVLMQFSVTADRLVFDPADARDVAAKLLHYADMAEGKKVQG